MLISLNNVVLIDLVNLKFLEKQNVILLDINIIIIMRIIFFDNVFIHFYYPQE